MPALSELQDWILIQDLLGVETQSHERSRPNNNELLPNSKDGQHYCPTQPTQEQPRPPMFLRY